MPAQVPVYTITSVALGCASTSGLAVNPAGDVFVSCDNLIRKVAANGAISTIAGGGVSNGFSGDGSPATSVALDRPQGVALDNSGNIYFAEWVLSGVGPRIRKVSSNGIITTIAGPGSTNGSLGDGGAATSASFKLPTGIAVDGAGNVYIADTGNLRVRKITPGGIITTLAGNGLPFAVDGGQATASGLSPTGIVLDGAGSLFIVDSLTRVRKVSPTGIISTVAGNGYENYFGDGGPATLAALPNATSVAVDAAGNLYIAEGSRVQMVGTNGVINSIAGGVPPSPAVTATGIATGPNGQIYLSTDTGIGLMAATGKTFSPPPMVIDYRTASDFTPLSRTLGLGCWVEIIGSYLAPDSRSWTGADFSGINAPTSLDGTTVTIGGQPAFISYISPGQINAEVPTNIGTGPQPMVVATKAGVASTLGPNGGALGPTINPSAPSILAPLSFPSLLGQFSRTIAAVFPDGVTYVLPTGFIQGVPSRPAKGGDTITFYGVGFGALTPNTPAGQIVQTSNAIQAPVQVSIGASSVSASYAGLVPGVVGLYQFNVTLPKTIPTPYVGLSVTLGGVSAAGVLSTQ